MMSWVRALVWVIQHGRCAGCIAREPRNENTGAGSSPGCTARTEKSIVRPSSRGGVPVLSRPTGRSSSRRRAPRALGRRVAGAPGRVVLQADVDEPGQERPGGQHDGVGAEDEADLGDDARDAVALEHEVVDGLLEHVRFA